MRTRSFGTLSYCVYLVTAVLRLGVASAATDLAATDLEDGDSGGVFGRLFRLHGGKQEAVTKGDTSVADEQDHVSVKEISVVLLSILVLLESDWIWT
jgi:hypothetical protein